jgi:hypothetical protein
VRVLLSALKSLDWQMISFIALNLANEYMINIQLPKIYYWNGERDYQTKKIKTSFNYGDKNKVDEDKPNDHDKAA